MPGSAEINILVAEDFPAIREILCDFLSRLGYKKVTQAKDGYEAMELIKQQEFDLMFLDWNMPGLTGIEVLKNVRENPQYRDVPVIMVTIKQETEDMMEATKAGATDYITKPFSIKTIASKMDKLFGKRGY